MRRAWKVIVACACLAAACGDSDPAAQSDGGVPDSIPGGEDGGEPVFDVQTISACGQSGYQTVAATNQAGKVAFAAIGLESTTSECTVQDRPPTQTNELSVCYVESTDGGSFAGAKVVTQQYVSVAGVGLALDAAGQAVLALAGGEPGTYRCGGSDLVTYAGSGSSFTPTTIVTDSASSGLVPEQAAACSAQDVCNQGDCTGYFPAVAIDSGGNPVVAFRDMHFGFADTDYASSDVEFVHGPGYSVLTIDVARGGGLYTRLALDPASGLARVAHYNGDGTDEVNGVWVNAETESGWVATRVKAGPVGEQLGFAVAPSGLVGLAYYDEDRKVLTYHESADGVTWSAGVDVDTDGLTGQYPALAFDPSGQPAIAYYRCNDYDPSTITCDQQKDGLYLARRSGGRWLTHAVRAESGLQEGLYPALAFQSGKAVIAYQSRWFDGSAGTNVVYLHVARER